jgi:iron complex outermembrane receptor protein
MVRSLVAASRRASLVLSSLGLASAAAWSQGAQPNAAASATSAASAASAARPTASLPAVVITGNPLGAATLSVPSTVLGGEALLRERGSTLGDTLGRQPGVAQSWFGPNASRPILRGQDGDRVRMLANGGASIDASSLSFDHAVPVDPLVVERLEVLRGPAALLYGGSAIGGVVNSIDNRIPRTGLERLGGAVEARLGGAQTERGGAVLLEGGNGSAAFHLDAFGRRTSDLSVPSFQPIEADGTLLPRTDRVRNSASRAAGGAIGGSWTGSAGFLGVSADRYDSTYGVVVDPDVTIRMKRDRLSAAGEARGLSGPIARVSGRFDTTRYRHDEIEGGGEIGTRFASEGQEGRLELEHVPIGPRGALRGVFGVQTEDVDFSALGEEAFVPRTRTTKRALFALESWTTRSLGTLTGGVRVERVRVASDGDSADAPAVRFGGPDARRFTATSASLGHVLPFGSGWTLSGHVASSSRAPTSYELFADGLHVATGAYERGDRDLALERGNSVDAAVEWKGEGARFRVGVFASRFGRFVSLESTGTAIDIPDENGVPEAFAVFAYRAIKARFAGFEVEAETRWSVDGWRLGVSGHVDRTRASNRATGEPLPRIAPLRAVLAADVGTGPWDLRVELEHASRQSRVPATDTPTAGHTLLHVAATWRVPLGGADLLASLALRNATDRLAFNASSIETVRGLAPLGGRSVRAGLRLAF